MSINILSQDGKKLVNYNNVASLSIRYQFMSDPNPFEWWEIIAMYPAVSSDILYDTLAIFETQKDCEKAFAELTYEIYSENAIIKL